MRTDSFQLVCILRNKRTSGYYIVLPSMLDVVPGDKLSLQFRVHGTEKWYSLFAKACRFGSSSTGAYIPKVILDCMEGKEGDLLDVQVEVEYCGPAGE